jgi:poly(A) polymerase
LASAYDSLELRIAELAEREDLAAIRPDLDGNDIMAELGLGPGRAVGEAYRHLLALRMELGPMSREDAVAALHEWAADQGIGA